MFDNVQQRKGSSVTFDKYSIAIGDMVLVTDEAVSAHSY
jgi:hypothetical protein